MSFAQSQSSSVSVVLCCVDVVENQSNLANFLKGDSGTLVLV
jgi:hypothetical protein